MPSSARFILFRLLGSLSFNEEQLEARFREIESFAIDGSDLLPEGSLGLKDSVQAVNSIILMARFDYPEVFAAINAASEESALVDISILFDDLQILFESLEELKEFWEIEDPPLPSSSSSLLDGSSSELIPSSSEDDTGK